MREMSTKLLAVLKARDEPIGCRNGKEVRVGSIGRPTVGGRERP